MVCIYCKAGLTDKTRWAHVWPASLGGRRRSRKICCDVCNNEISAAENQLRTSLVHAFAAAGATNDDREPFEMKVSFEGQDFVYSEGNADLQPGPTRFDPEAKSISVPLPAGLDNQADAMAKALWSQGLGPDHVHKLTLTPGDPPPVLPEGPQRNDYDLALGKSTEHRRVFVKMAVELLAYHRHDLAVRGELSEARRFARHGSGMITGKPDYKSEGSGLIEAAAVPEVFNAIEVWSFQRSVFFRVTFLGPLTFTGTLTTEWVGEPFRAAYAFDARDPARAITDSFVAGDGHNLAVWFDGIKEETVEKAIEQLEAISLRLARSAPKPQREPPPDIDVLRAAVRERLEKMPPKKKRKTP